MKHAIFITGGGTHMPDIHGLLNERGYEIHWLASSDDATPWNSEAHADIAIVSLNALTMKENPFALVQQLRQQWPAVPVLFLLRGQAYGKTPAVQDQDGVYCVTEPVDLSLFCKFLDLLTTSHRDGQPVIT
ncbi:MAG: hypothetical protein ACLFTT_05550 [Candidatus Hydrogenedentota bacterium]